MAQTSYKTKQNDTWATISFKSYGTPHEMNRIIQANPSIPIEASLSGGINILIPIISTPTANPEKLPPWRQLQD